MAVTFTAEGPLGFITLDNPPANSYDLGVHERSSATRSTRPSSAPPAS